MSQFIDTLLRFALGRFAPLLLAIPLCAALYWQPQWYAWFGIPTPDQSLLPNLPAAAGFGSAFLVGWLLQRQTGLLVRIERQRWIHLVSAVLATAASLWLVGISPGFEPTTPGGDKLLRAALYAVASWSWTLSMIGLTLRYCANFSPMRRYLADASYWIYLAHLPLVMALQVAIAPLAWPALFKLVLILFVSLSLLLLSYRWFVRTSFIGAVLNGRRRQRGATAGMLPIAPATTATGVDLR